METKKMPLNFLAEAINEAKCEIINKYTGTCCVHATGNYTVFWHENKCLVLRGDLHDKVESDFCIVFDLRYSNGSAVITSQRIY